MAAPSGITWGDIVSGYGRIGIYIGITNTNTQTKVNVQVWFWSKYSVSDTSNKYYYNNKATSATTLIASRTIKHTVDTGSGWSTSNQTKLGESTYTYDRGTSAVTYSCAAKLTGIEAASGTMTHTRSYTIPALTKYTVSYSANGGSGAPGSQTKYYGKTLTLSSTKPTRTGYTFLGWSTSSSATSATWAAGGSYTTNASDTLYAVWKENALTVNYYSNYATSYNGTSEALNTVNNNNVLVYSQKYYYDNTYPSGLLNYDSGSTLGMIRTGYTATGKWGTSTSGGTLVDEDDTSFTTGQAFAEKFGKSLKTGNASVNVYAQWKINTYTVSYNANGGSGAPSSQTKTYGKALTLSSTKPTKIGYTFLGWSTSSSATSATWAAGGSYTTNASDTLYAVWKANTYTLSYDANGGSGAPGSQSYTYAASGTITLSSTKPTRTGYTFSKWNTKADGSGTSYNPGGTFNRYNSSTTLYAIWTINTYTVKYDANGGSGAPGNQTKTYGKTLTLSSTKPTRTGYTFQGWGTTPDDTSVNYNPGGTFTANYNDTLYAIWTENYLTVNYYSNYATSFNGALEPLNEVGAGNNVMILQRKYYYATEYANGLINYQTSSTNLYMTRTGYTGTGKWGTSTSGGNLIDEDTAFATGQALAEALGQTIASGNKEINIYAQWTINSYKLTVNPNGGTWNGSSSSQEFTQNYNTTKSIPDPTWTGHTFSGWTKSGSGTLEDGTFTFGAGAGTLKATWDTNVYTLTLNPNGGTLDGSTSAEQITDEYGTSIKLPTPTRTGYTFCGWGTTDTDAIPDYAPNGSLTMDGNKTLYAIWLINIYHLTVNPNGGTWSGSTSSQEFGQIYNSSKTISNPTRTGYTFDGWTLSGSGSLSGTTYKYGAGDGTLTANWTVNEYSILFDAETNGGWIIEDADGNSYESNYLTSISKEYDYGSAIGNMPIAYKKNYTFLGWFTAASGGTKITSAYNITGNETLYAQYSIDASAYVNDEGTWKAGVVFARGSDGDMKKGHVKINDENVWKDAFCR